jgi:hypothetical protein
LASNLLMNSVSTRSEILLGSPIEHYISYTNFQADAVQAHQQMFGGNAPPSGQPASSGTMGSAAAMQALKMFSGGSGGSSSGQGGQNAFIGMAMGQASKLFDQQSQSGNVAQGASKESAVQQAAEMALKMYMGGGGQSGSGGVSSLMGLASKFF